MCRASTAVAVEQLEPRVVIAGLGPGDAGQITREVWEAINSSSEVYARIIKHPALSELPPSVSVHTFDSFYDRADSFEALYSDIANEVLRLAKQQGRILYAVPGDPYVGESTTKLIVERGKASGVQVDVLSGVSFVEPTLSALGIDMLPRLLVGDAHELVSLCHLPFEPNTPLLISQIENQFDANALKLLLMSAFGPAHRVALVHAAGSPGCAVEWLRLYQIDRSDQVGVMTSLYVPASKIGTFAALRDAMASRREVLGDNWDRVSHAELAEGLRHAASEVVEASRQDGRGHGGLAGSLAAVLAHSVAHLQLAEDEEAFVASDVLARAASLAEEMLAQEGSVKGEDAS